MAYMRNPEDPDAGLLDIYDPNRDVWNEEPQYADGSTNQPTERKPFDRTAFRDAWMASGEDTGRQNQLLGEYGISLDQAGRGRLPSGDLLDLRYGAKAGINRASWTPVFDPQNPGAMPGGGGGYNGSMQAPSMFGGAGGSYGFDNLGNDEFSKTVQGGLMDLIRNKGSIGGLGDELSSSLIARLQGNGPDSLNSRLESAREGIDRARKSQINNIQGLLADRGLLSEGRITQGPEQSSYTRMEDSLAGQYGTTLRDIYADQLDRDNDLFGVAAGVAQNQANNYLNALNSATGRQDVVSRIALDSLAQNMDWQRFLATYGLDQQRFANDVEQGNIGNYLSLIQLYLNAAGQAREGYR